MRKLLSIVVIFFIAAGVFFFVPGVRGWFDDIFSSVTERIQEPAADPTEPEPADPTEPTEPSGPVSELIRITFHNVPDIYASDVHEVVLDGVPVNSKLAADMLPDLSQIADRVVLGYSLTEHGELVTVNDYVLTGDTELYCVWSMAYTVIWLSSDGNKIYETDTKVISGASPSFNSEIPTKSSTEEFEYSFAGWATTANATESTPVAELPQITNHVTYYAVFIANTRSYPVIWTVPSVTIIKNFSPEIDSTLYGTKPTFDREQYIHEIFSEYEYVFTGWTTSISDAEKGIGGIAEADLPVVTTGVFYFAVFTKQTRLYTITWENYDGATLAITEWEYHETPIYPNEIPTRPTTAEHAYEFVGWSPAVSDVYNDAVYTAIYSPTLLPPTPGDWDTVFSLNSPFAEAGVPYGLNSGNGLPINVFENAVATENVVFDGEYTFDFDFSPFSSISAIVADAPLRITLSNVVIIDLSADGGFEEPALWYLTSNNTWVSSDNYSVNSCVLIFDNSITFNYFALVALGVDGIVDFNNPDMFNLSDVECSFTLSFACHADNVLTVTLTTNQSLFIPMLDAVFITQIEQLVEEV